MDVQDFDPLLEGTPPGWYPDPAGKRKARYWDGRGWTREARSDMGVKTPPSADEIATIIEAKQAEEVEAEAAERERLRWSQVVVTTSHELPDARIASHVGEVFGITVRTRNMFSQAGAQMRGIVGGEVGGYTKLMQDARHESLKRLRQEADQVGANAVVSMRMEANQISSDMTEVVAYGAAVVIVPT